MVVLAAVLATNTYKILEHFSNLENNIFSCHISVYTYREKKTNKGTCSRRKNIHFNAIMSEQSHMTLRHKKLLNKLFLFFVYIYLFHLSSCVALFMYDNYRHIRNIMRLHPNSTSEQRMFIFYFEYVYFSV